MKKFKTLALMLLITLMANFIPVSAASVWDSAFGIMDVGFYEKEEGGREVRVKFDETNIENIKSVKLYTKVDKSRYGYVNNQWTWISECVEGSVFDLTARQLNNFICDLNESNIKDFGVHVVDRIEVILNDGTKKVSYNRNYYTYLGENDKENGELIIYNAISEEYEPLYIENSALEKGRVKLGESQNFTFDVLSNKSGVKPSKIYITFKKYSETNPSEQVVVAEKIDEIRYKASLTLNNSLDTGDWQASTIEFVDNYGRTFKTEANSNTFLVVSENADIDAPVLESIVVEKNIFDASVENQISFFINASDDISGIEDIWLQMKNGDSTTTWTNCYVEENSQYNYRVDLGGLIKNGTYEMEIIKIKDKAGNYNYYVPSKEKYMNSYERDRYFEWDFSNLTIEVINSTIQEDVEVEPLQVEILDLKNYSQNITNGNEVSFELQVKSNKAIVGGSADFIGPEYRYIRADFYNDDYSFNENGYVVYNKSEDGIYTLKFTANHTSYQYLGSGKYIIDYIFFYCYDENNSYQSYYLYDPRKEWVGDNVKIFDFSPLDVYCENPNEDILAPEILEISFDNAVTTPGGSVEVSIKATDDKSGFKEESYWRSPMINYWIGNKYLSVNLNEYDEVNNIFKGRIEIPSYLSTGVYNPQDITISDIAGNTRNYNWYNMEERSVLSQGTILVKRNLNELLPPVISTNIKKDNEVFKAPFTPIVTTDHGTVKMVLNGEEYNGEPINKLGDYHLYIVVTGVDGSVSTSKVTFKVITEISNDTTADQIIEQIINSTEKVIELQVKNDSLEVDKSIFEAIKGTDKTVSFTQEDGTVWTFEGKDIKDENLAGIGNVKISVSNIPAQENRESISSIDSAAKVIHFDYHGVLPGKAKVKVKVENPEDVMGKELTFYYFNPETQKAEKIQGPLSVDNNGFITVEIEHCSDYFLSVYDNLHLAVEEQPQVPVEEQPQVPVEEQPQVPVEEQPQVPVEEQPQVPVEEQPQVPVEEQPQVPAEEQPQVPVEEKPEVPVEEQSQVPVEEQPEAPLEEAAESKTNNEKILDAKIEVAKSEEKKVAEGKGLPNTGRRVSSTTMIMVALIAIVGGFKLRKRVK